MNNTDPPLDEQPPPAPAPQPGMTQTPLYSVDSLGPERIVSIEAIIAEHYGNFERRRQGEQKQWMWRPPRNPQVRGTPDWMPRPPTLLRDQHCIAMFDALTAREGWDWLITACVINVDGQNLRAYLCGLGHTEPGGAFRGKQDYRVLTREIELGAMLLLVRLSGLTIDGMHGQLFAKPHLLSAVQS